MAEMQNIIIDDGSRRVPIQNKFGDEIGAFTFRPTDMGIIQRYNAMVSKFDEIMEPLTAVDGDGEIDLDDPKYAAALTEATERMYAAVDALLDSEGAGLAFFGKMNPFSPVGGAFYCANVLNSLGAYIGAAFDTEMAKFSANAKKYAKKAKK